MGWSSARAGAGDGGAVGAGDGFNSVAVLLDSFGDAAGVSLAAEEDGPANSFGSSFGDVPGVGWGVGLGVGLAEGPGVGSGVGLGDGPGV